jgi:histidinol phosphatase-like PHP family hydrolase
MGARLSISTDAHSKLQLVMMKYGVFTARRAWLEAKHVVNTLAVGRLLKAVSKLR